MSSWCSGRSVLQRVQLVKEIIEEEITPATATSAISKGTSSDDFENDSVTSDSADVAQEGGASRTGKVLQAGLFPPSASQGTILKAGPTPPALEAGCRPLPSQSSANQVKMTSAGKEGPFTRRETFFVFDWDDTILPSTWVQNQGLRLDAGSTPNAAQRTQLGEAAAAGAKTLRVAKQHGTVVLVTNAERGWIELSCRKFLPTLYPLLEDVRLVSARTTYEGQSCISPLDWKLRAFDDEIERHYRAEVINDPLSRKNVFSLGDSVHEREALLRATSTAPNCRSKSLKFAERPSIAQLCKQHELVSGSFAKMVHHDGNLDLCIRCP